MQRRGLARALTSRATAYTDDTRTSHTSWRTVCRQRCLRPLTSCDHARASTLYYPDTETRASSRPCESHLAHRRSHLAHRRATCCVAQRSTIIVLHCRTRDSSHIAGSGHSESKRFDNLTLKCNHVKIILRTRRARSRERTSMHKRQQKFSWQGGDGGRAAPSFVMHRGVHLP